VSYSPKSADIAALMRLATPPIKNPVTVIRTPQLLKLFGESAKTNLNY